MSQLFDLEAIIRPISESKPAGDYLIYSAVYADLAAAHAPAAGSRPGRPEPDWQKVVKIGLGALESQTKDIQIAAYVSEALTWLQGLDGLRQGLLLFQALQDAFWPTLFPSRESETDLGGRMAPYEFMDEMLPRAVYIAIPLTKAPLAANYNLQQLSAVGPNLAERESRNDVIRRTEPSFHERLSADLAACREAFAAWRDSTARHMAQSPPLESLATVLDKFGAALAEIEGVRPFAAPPARQVAAGLGQARTQETRIAQAPAGDQESTSSAAFGGASTEELTRAAGAPQTSHLSPQPDARVDIAAAARELAATGQLEAAIELIDGARLSARCRRDRFIRQLELVELCLGRGLVHVARPLLDELANELEARKLEEWEDPALCSRVLVASIACLRASKFEMDAERVPGIIERLFRLDPRQALRRDLKL